MKRPLAWLCLCLVMLAALRLYISEQSSAKWQDILSFADGGPITVTGRVYEKKENQIYIESIPIQDNFANPQNEFPKNVNLICECEYGEEVSLGSVVEVKGAFRCFSSATNPGEFDAYDYYMSQGIIGKIWQAQVSVDNAYCEWHQWQTDAEECVELCESQSNTDECWWLCNLLSVMEWYWELRELLYDLRVYWEGRLYQVFPEKEASIMCTMLLGDKDVLDKEIKDSFQQNGIAHILSISGLHITIIGMGIYEMLRRIGVGMKPAAVFGAVILVLYGTMTGMSVSTRRAIGMYLIRMLGEVLGRTYDSLTAVAVIGAVMVCVNPKYLVNCGFLLSYGAILGIGILYPALMGEMEDASRQWNRKMRGKIGILPDGMSDWMQNWIIRALSNLCAHLFMGLRSGWYSGLSVTLMTLPIQLWFFYEVPVYSLLLNLLVIPLMTAIMIGGLVTMLLPIGNGMVAYVPYGILKSYEWACALFDKLPFHTWNPGKPEVWQVVVYYVLLLLVVKWNSVPIVKWCRWRKISQLIVLTIAVILLKKWNFTGNMMTVLDVGQGDGICLEMETGEVYLFDCGSTSRSGIGEYVLIPFLKYSGISHIDAIFISHPDADHCSGIMELLALAEEKRIAIDRIVLPAIAEERRTEVFQEILDVIQVSDSQIMKDKRVAVMSVQNDDAIGVMSMGTSEATEVMYIGSGDTWEVGDLNFTCLHPEKGTAEEDANAYSECFYVEGQNGFSLLLTGDVEEEGEEELLAELQKRNIQDITILKVAHHGSKNSSSAEFLAQIRPKVAIISCGENNSYGHPHEETMKRLGEVGSEVLVTLDYGAITIEFDEKIEVRSWFLPD